MSFPQERAPDKKRMALIVSDTGRRDWCSNSSSDVLNRQTSSHRAFARFFESLCEYFQIVELRRLGTPRRNNGSLLQVGDFSSVFILA